MERSTVCKHVRQKHSGKESKNIDDTPNGKQQMEQRTKDEGKFGLNICVILKLVNSKVQTAPVDPSPSSSCVAEVEHDPDFIPK